jgi:hypothetical protein
MQDSVDARDGDRDGAASRHLGRPVRGGFVMTRTSTRILVAALALASAAFAAAGGCNYAAGVNSNPTGAAAGSTSAGASGTGTAGAAGSSATGMGGSPFTFGNQYMMTGTGGAAPSGPCMNLTCQQSSCRGMGCTVTCQAGQRTTVSGKVYDPAGLTPLYNITVYVPNADLDPISDGPSCDPCDPNTGTSLLSGKPVVFTKTDTSGQFTLGKTSAVDVPAGTNIPLVLQVGKWQRKIILPTVTACQDNAIPDKTLRLPKDSTEGHIPKIALTTGASDAMECLFRKIGIQDPEFTTTDGKGRINLIAGGVIDMKTGLPTATSSFAAMPASGSQKFTPVHPGGGGADWWDSLDNLKKYDIVMHSCEGGDGQYTAANDPTSTKSQQARMALQQYADLGGRVFASHWHTYWFEKGTPDFMSVATFLNPHGNGLPQDRPTDTTIDQTFDKGQALAQWMLNVQGSTVLGTVPIQQNASATEVAMAAGPPISQRWLYAPTQNNTVLFLSATTPIPNATNKSPNACGRVVLSDLHVSAGGTGSDMPNTAFPGGCVTTTLSPREKVLEFMLFDIASCVAPIVQ